MLCGTIHLFHRKGIAESMNVMQPEIPELLDDGIDVMNKLLSEDKVQEGIFTGESFTNENMKGLDVLRCRFVKCEFTQACFEQAGFRDVVFENCDFSNCDFTKAAFQRVAFLGCKLMGADFIESALRSVRFFDCDARYANFADGKAQEIAFENVRLENAAFLRFKLTASFSQCSLSQATFEQTLMKGFDLRTCRLGGLQVTLSDIKGAIVTPVQAADLAALLGLVIKEPEE